MTTNSNQIGLTTKLQEWCNYATNLESQISKCEHVTGNVYKEFVANIDTCLNAIEQTAPFKNKASRDVNLLVEELDSKVEKCLKTLMKKKTETQLQQLPSTPSSEPGFDILEQRDINQFKQLLDTKDKCEAKIVKLHSEIDSKISRKNKAADDIILCGNEVKRRSDLIKRGSTFDGHQLTATEIKNLKSQIDQFKTAQTNLLNEIDTLNPLIDKLQ